MRILHVIGQLVRGGSERQLLCTVEALQRRGWHQSVVTFNPGDVWESQVAKIGVPLLIVPRSDFKLSRIWRLRSLIKSERPDLLHSWSNHTNVYSHWASRGLGVRLIQSIRGNPELGFVDRGFGRALRALNRRSYDAADCVISNSQAGIDQLLKSGVKPRNAYVVGNIVQVRGRARVAENVRVPRIVAAGVLVPNKAYEVLLEALGRLRGEGQSFEFLLAGEGPERSRLENLVTQLGLGERVEFLGGIENVPDLLASAHMVVHTSRSEGLSNTLLEAMAEGLPVIATNVGGTPELVKDGESGMLVPPDDPVLLAARIKQLLNDPDLRLRLGQSGLRLVRSRYSTETVVSQYERIYESQLADQIDSKRVLIPASNELSASSVTER